MIVQSDTQQTVNERPETAHKRQQILAAATKVFGEKGAAKGTLEEIAQEVGMTRAGVLHYFGSKDNLLLQAVIFRDTEDVADYPVQELPEGDDTFRHLIKTAGYNAQRLGLVKAFVMLSAEATTNDSPRNTYFVERYRKLRGQLRDALFIMAEERHMPMTEELALQTAASILAVMDGLQLQWILDPEHIDLARETTQAIHTILAGVFDVTQEERDTILD